MLFNPIKGYLQHFISLTAKHVPNFFLSVCQWHFVSMSGHGFRFFKIKVSKTIISFSYNFWLSNSYTVLRLFSRTFCGISLKPISEPKINFILKVSVIYTATIAVLSELFITRVGWGPHSVILKIHGFDDFDTFLDVSCFLPICSLIYPNVCLGIVAQKFKFFSFDCHSLWKSLPSHGRKINTHNFKFFNFRVGRPFFRLSRPQVCNYTTRR